MKGVVVDYVVNAFIQNSKGIDEEKQ